MSRPDVVTLVGESPASHGIYDTFTAVERKVFVDRRSVGMREAYTAASVGLHPEVVFRLALAEDHKNERRLTWNSTSYKIVRTYLDGDGIELVCERWTGDV